MPKNLNERLAKADTFLKLISAAVSATRGATARIEGDQREIKARMEKLEREG